MKDYLSLKAAAESEIVIERSRFLGFGGRITCEEDAAGFIERIKRAHPEAAHHCFAYISDSLGNLMRFSDDKEPQGTAGLPILEVLKAKELKESIIVVVRYFGGVKLGAGGLVRAYSGCAAETADACGIAKVMAAIAVTVIVSYEEYPALKKFIDKEGLTVTDTKYEGDVKVSLMLPLSQLLEFKERIMDITLGRAVLFEGEKSYFTF